MTVAAARGGVVLRPHGLVTGAAVSVVHEKEERKVEAEDSDGEYIAKMINAAKQRANDESKQAQLADAREKATLSQIRQKEEALQRDKDRRKMAARVMRMAHRKYGETSGEGEVLEKRQGACTVADCRGVSLQPVDEA